MNVNINVNWQIPTIKKVLISGKVVYERSNLSLTVSTDDSPVSVALSRFGNAKGLLCITCSIEMYVFRCFDYQQWIAASYLCSRDAANETQARQEKTEYSEK